MGENEIDLMFDILHQRKEIEEKANKCTQTGIISLYIVPIDIHSNNIADKHFVMLHIYNCIT